MSSFTESGLVKKLMDLNPTQQTIQTLSLWLIHHRKHYENIVKVWLKEMLNASKSKKLTFMFLANDVIQNSKRKGPEYNRAFSKVLLKAFIHIHDVCSDDKKTLASLDRILTIWEDRHVYEEHELHEYRRALHGSRSSGNGDSTTSSTGEKRQQRMDDSGSHAKKAKLTPSKSEVIEINGTKETHVTLSPHETFGDPPEPEELIKSLQEIENSASSDVTVRQKIANLPLEFTEVSMLSKLEDKEAALKLAQEVNDAVKLLNDYNNRLCREMEDRKKLQVMLKDYAQEQRELLSQAQSRLEEYTKKLVKIKDVQKQIRNHIGNLPDLKQLPDVTGGLAPLPSAGDLFKLGH